MIKRFKSNFELLAFAILVSVFFQNCGTLTSSPVLKKAKLSSNIGVVSSSKEELDSEYTGDQLEFVEEDASSKLEKNKTRHSARKSNPPQRFTDNPKTETPLKKQDFSTADEDLNQADPRNYVGGNGLPGGFKWDTVVELPEVSIEDYFKKGLHKRLLETSSILRKETKKNKNNNEVKQKQKERVIKGSPSPNGKNIKPINVRIKIVDDPVRIVSLHVAGDIAAIFHKKDTKEQGPRPYSDLAKILDGILKTEDDRGKFIKLVSTVVIDNKDIQKEYEQLLDKWKDALLDFIGIQVAEMARAYFHAQDNKEHLTFNLAAVHHALKKLETTSFLKVYVQNCKTHAPFAGKGGAKFFKEEFCKSKSTEQPSNSNKPRKLNFELPLGANENLFSVKKEKEMQDAVNGKEEEITDTN